MAGKNINNKINYRQISLFNILKAYSNYDKEVSYVQGMSDLTAFLLMYFTEEVFYIFIIFYCILFFYFLFFTFTFFYFLFVLFFILFFIFYILYLFIYLLFLFLLFIFMVYYY